MNRTHICHSEGLTQRQPALVETSRLGALENASQQAARNCRAQPSKWPALIGHCGPSPTPCKLLDVSHSGGWEAEPPAMWASLETAQWGGGLHSAPNHPTRLVTAQLLARNLLLFLSSHRSSNQGAWSSSCQGQSEGMGSSQLPIPRTVGSQAEGHFKTGLQLSWVRLDCILNF